MSAPYIGLRPYTREDSALFFGREGDTQILLDKILANRLTLLFAASGVGKSSLLQAGIMLKLAGRVFYFNSWVVDPLHELKRAIVAELQLQGLLPESHDAALALPLRDFLRRYTVFCEDAPVLILDQFEEFFNYQRFKPEFAAFVGEFADTVQDRTLNAQFVLSMREDFALELNAFKSALPGLFDNYYRLEKLRRAAALDALHKPLLAFDFRYEDGLLEEILSDLSQREQSYGLAAALAKDAPLWVEPPHIQIVCSQLWESEQHQAARVIRRAVYVARGRAAGLLANFFLRTVNALTLAEKRLVSGAFDFLVNQRRGAKEARALGELAALLRCPPVTLRAVLDTLENARILRRQQRPDDVWYELYHDLFTHSILEWNQAFKLQQRLRRAVKVAAMAAGFIGMVVVGFDYYQNRTAQYLSLHPQTGALELYQGKLDSFDFFGQRGFLAETGYSRDDIQADLRFFQQDAPPLPQLTQRLISLLPLAERQQAYLDSGEIDRAVALAKEGIAPVDLHLSQQLLENLAMARFSDTAQVLAGLAGEGQHEIIRELMLEAINRLAPLGKPLIPVLLPLLAYYNATQALIDLQATASIPQLIAALKNENSAVRSNAAQVLGAWDVKAAIPDLIALLKDDEWLVRYYTANALGNLQATQAIPDLIALLKDENGDVRQSATDGLVTLQATQAIPDLIALLKDDNGDVRARAAEGLVKLQATQAIPDLIPLLKDPDSDVRQSAADVLVKLQAAQAIPDLIPLLKDPDSDVRQSAADALGQLQATQAIPDLIPLLKDENNYVRQSAADGLVKLQATQAIPNLIALLKDPDSAVRRRAAYVLGELQAVQAIPDLISLLKDEDSGVRYRAADALGQLQATQAIPDLIPLLKDENNYVRQSAADGLVKLQAAQAIPDLIPLLKDPEWPVRQSAADALGQLQATQAIPDLIALLKDENNYVRQSAADGLVKLQAAQALPELLALLDAPELEIRKMALEALENLRVTRIQPELAPRLAEVKRQLRHERIQANLSLLTHYDEDTRATAAAELGEWYAVQAVPNLMVRLKDTTIIRGNSALALQQLGSSEGARLARQAEERAWEEYEKLPDLYIPPPLIATELPVLKTKLTELENAKTDWREARDRGELKPENQPPEWEEAEIAHTIARLDCHEGMNLLKHPFYNVRLGAWTGLGFYAKAGTVKRLAKAFEQAQDQKEPFYYQALYRALDTALVTLEVKGDADDLAILENLRAPYHKGLEQRLRWTEDAVRERVKS